MSEKKGFFQRLRERLNKGDSILTRDITELLPSSGKPDEGTLEELETRLLMADVGVDATRKIMDGLYERLDRKALADGAQLMAGLEAEIESLLGPVEVPLVPEHSGEGPFVILVVGVNGAGKTTTIGKLARRFRDEGRSVMLAAGDTFRAAAVEQLQAWGERNEVPVIAHATGADSAAVAHDAVQSALARGTDVLMIDTAGRLHTQAGLMDELRKVKRVIQKAMPSAPHETLLVLDGSTGQNAIAQAREFNSAVDLSGLVVTKLDGSARGGVILAVARELGVPVRFIGIGEGAEDLDVFRAKDFTRALVEKSG
ncbi:signal recognition particle-docking protein FtsY [Natronospira bacteriovora]|uniref:Signal recognition particle receptor FtsY n=2 Tax=Natronospira bacteriovora TaxID=3069753 RepID=A0ABU0W870_9GAMM|nr:signal recognition particle-docking protein FtsY [Natronospira sp. AB-CW4]MDQ2070157.1 signal recognition particle-docking protein FtsY [Natronospira sp. AB-CW4]